MFEYRSEILKVIDGHTVIARIDLGFHTFVVQQLRLHGMDAPEIHRSGLTPADRARGHASKAQLAAMIQQYRPILVNTLKDVTGDYGGHYLALLYGKNADGPVCLNLEMVRDGHATDR